MDLTPRLELRQSQTLVMTPQLQQAIKLLQLSNLELKEYVEQELERNPLLEREEEDGNDLDADQRDRAADDPDQARHVEGEPLDDIDIERTEGGDGLDPPALDVDYDNLYNNDSASDAAPIGEGTDWAPEPLGRSPGCGPGGGFDGDRPSLEETLSNTVSLRDHVTQQMSVELADPVDRIIGVQLFELLDEAGYVSGDLAEVADALGCPVGRVEATLETLQQLDPPGIFARSLSECLAIQLRDRNRLDPAMVALLDNLELLARREFARLETLCGVDREDLADMATEIRSLDPKPALAFDHVVLQPITPDVLMRPAPGGGWTVELNAETLPRVLVNNHYHARISRQALTKKDRQYIAERMQSANWLVKSLHQRATTILKVATELVRQQNGFFTHGVTFLRPLVLRDIAAAVDRHESTVSRVTSNKFMATPRGIYELKYFFTSAIARAGGGEAHSAESVRHRIRVLIESETAERVLSDDQIVGVLRSDGIDIARRTVAKYRESLGISSSVQRRREKMSPL